MGKNETNNSAGDGRRTRRRFTKEFKEQAVQMLLDGHSAASVAERLGLSGPSLDDVPSSVEGCGVGLGVS